MGLIQANFGSNMSWVDFGFVSNGFSYKQWPLHSCYRVFRWPRQISFHQKRGPMIWKQQKSKNLGFDAKSSNCPLQIARGQCQIAHGKCQGPRANSQVQISNWQVRLPSAKGKLQWVRGQEFHTRGANINQKHTHFRKTKASIVRVSNSNHELRWFWCKFPLANARGPRARGQLQITNCDCKWPRAKGKLQEAKGKGFHTRYTKIK